MKEWNLLKTIVFVGLIAIILLGCSSETGQFSPEQVINNALQEEKSPGSYYAEAEWTLSGVGPETVQMFSKEWHSEDGKVRLEIQNIDTDELVITVNDGNALMIYNDAENEAYMFDDPELQEMNQLSPKDQAMRTLEMITDTHELTSEGEVDIIGRTAYHLKAKAKEEGKLIGDQEIWIDKESWIILKTISQSGVLMDEIAYTVIDFDANIPESTFTLDLPDDVHLQTFDDMNASEEITLTEAVEELGTSFYYFPEQDGMEINVIELSELDGIEIKRKEIDISYIKDDLPLFSVGVFESEDELKEEDMLPGDEVVTIRGQKGHYSDMDGFRALLWQEDGLRYSLLFVDPAFTLEELQQLAENMIEVE